MTAPTASDFAALDIRVDRMLSVQPFPEARRAAGKPTLDIGTPGTRGSRAQSTNYSPEDLIVRCVVEVTNIGTRRIAGFTSECLVLASIGEDGVPVLSDAGSAQLGDRTS